MRIVIVGVGDVGLELAQNLSHKKDAELVLIDTDEKRCDMLAEQLDALVLTGDGSDPKILQKAQIAAADALVATTGSDAINTVIAMLGHRFGVEKIVVKLKGFGLRSACQEIGVSKVIAPKISAAAEIISALYGFDRVNFSIVASGGLQLVSLQADEALGKRISEFEMPDGSHLVAVLRDDRMLIPRGKLRLEQGDELLVLIEDKNVLERLKDRLARKTEE